MVRQIAIIGAGGLGREVHAILKAINEEKQAWDIIGFFDDTKKEGLVNGLPYLGTVGDLHEFNEDLNLVLAIGNPVIKKKIHSKIPKVFQYPNIIHPKSLIDFETLTIGLGNIIAPKSALTVNITLGDFVTINTAAILAHDVQVGNYSMIMPSACISAGAKIETEVYIGNGVKIDQPITIESGAVIPMGQHLSFQKKKDDKIYLSTSDVSLKNTYPFYFNAILNNQVTTKGENVSGFEQDLENYLGENVKVAALSAGTAAIHLALILSGVKQEDVVLCQSFTFSASANPITYQGAKPVFVDSEAETWNMCPIALEEAIQKETEKGQKPKAIIVVHLYGMPAKMKEIVAVAKKYDIKLIEDAAEALGSTYNNQKCGTFGDYGILSFNGNKIITASGGGALVCKTKEEKQKAIFLATQARDEAPHYQHSQIGYNYRMSNIVAGIGRGQMEVLDKHVQLRRANHQFYQKLFKNIEGISVFQEPNDHFFSNHWLSCIVMDDENSSLTVEEIRLALLEVNIESRPLWKPMHVQPVFTNSPFYRNGLSEQLFEKGLCLPSGSNLSDDDKKRIQNVFEAIL